MSATDRQNRLLVAEDWKRIYQSFRNADFQSYDFENLRRVMINYLRDNYPEDFNDYIESSEYIALIDMIAFIGQSVSFRIDLNARENFLELAERQDSILRLAKLISYNPKRNIAANGLLKFVSIQTTQHVLDINGRDLSGNVITWNDQTNQNWHDQFIKILNASLSQSGQYGNPDDKAVIYDIPTEQYRFQALNTDVPIYKYSRSIDGRNMEFEIVSTSIKGGSEISEEPPLLGNRLSFLYRDDGQGYGSANTGFFINFKQGTLGQGTFTVAQPSTNETLDIDVEAINNSDVWLYRLNENGLEQELWTQVPSFEGNNVIYNSLSKNIKNIYSINTRANDKISLTFSDGTFGNIPLGDFRIYYRTSNGLNYTIHPKDMRNISFSLQYVSNVGQVETLTVYANLMSSVNNSSAPESMNSIKTNAPANFYTQNRMITGEDYNIAPLTVSQEVVKIKAVNRSASGISRYLDLIDPTGKYSKTNLFSDDGALYKEEYFDTFKFSYMTKIDIEHIIYNQVYDILKNNTLRDYYYSKFAEDVSNGPLLTETVSETNSTTGSLNVDLTNLVDNYSPLRYISIGALLKFEKDNKAIWTSVISIPNASTGTLLLNDIIPENALLVKIIPSYRKTIDSGIISSMIELIYNNKPFGLRYDSRLHKWDIITSTNLDTLSDFSRDYENNTNNENKNSSWLLLFTTDGQSYTIKYRQLRYIFESDTQIRFFYDNSNKIYNSKTGSVIKDNIKILLPDSSSMVWEISDEYIGTDGYVDTKKIQLTFADSDDDGIVDNPELFPDYVVGIDQYIVTEQYTVGSTVDYKLCPTEVITDFLDTEPTSPSTSGYYYIKDSKVVKYCDGSTWIITNKYKVYEGKRNINFQYIHNASYDSRIDPGVTNIMDIYVLTSQYDSDYRKWLANPLTNDMPVPPSTDYLYNVLSPSLNKIKAMSDDVIYHPVRFKLLFGNMASSDVQATFKIVKNSELVISDNDVKTRTLSAINDFFKLQNWDFGDSFYFSELTSYVMNRLSPYIVNFIIVPVQDTLSFGSLYEIHAEKDQIFINGATVDNIEIISAITANTIKSVGAIN